MAHPFHLLIYRFLPLTAAINIEMLATYVAALAGMFLFLRHLALPAGRPRLPARCCSRSVGFSSFTSTT